MAFLFLSFDVHAEEHSSVQAQDPHGWWEQHGSTHKSRARRFGFETGCLAASSGQVNITDVLRAVASFSDSQNISSRDREGDEGKTPVIPDRKPVGCKA